MQMEKANQLEKAWEESGKPPHEDHSWAREMYLGTKTTDDRCTICGATRTPAECR